MALAGDKRTESPARNKGIMNTLGWLGGGVSAPANRATSANALPRELFLGGEGE